MNFTVYSKNGCPYCTKVKQVLQLAELPFVEYKQGTDFTKEEFISEFGKDATYPRVLKNEEVLDRDWETCFTLVQYGHPFFE